MITTNTVQQQLAYRLLMLWHELTSTSLYNAVPCIDDIVNNTVQPYTKTVNTIKKVIHGIYHKTQDDMSKENPKLHTLLSYIVHYTNTIPDNIHKQAIGEIPWKIKIKPYIVILCYSEANTKYTSQVLVQHIDTVKILLYEVTRKNWVAAIQALYVYYAEHLINIDIMLGY